MKRWWIAGVLIIPFFLAHPARAVDCNAITWDICGDNPDIAAQCSSECQRACAGALGQFTGTPMGLDICTQCKKVADNIGTVSDLLSGFSSGLSNACAVEAIKSAADATKFALCNKDPANPDCCISVEHAAEGDRGEVRLEECKSGTKWHIADCYCAIPAGGPTAFQKEAQTYPGCVDLCKKNNGSIDSTQGIGLFASTEGAGQGPQQIPQSSFINALCFTQEECASPDYGGTSDAWVPDPTCPNNKGKCRAPEPEVTLSSPVLGVTSIKGFRNYVDLMFRYMLGIVAIAATIMFVYSGFRYIVGSSMGSIKSAKETMVNAVIGLLLSFGAVTILNLVNPATTHYSPLNIWMVNRQAFSNLEYCRDYQRPDPSKPAPSKELTFAYVGNPPVAFESIKPDAFTLKVGETQCGETYYPNGYAGNTCKGSACGDGQVCIPCKAGAPGCPESNKSGSACVDGSFAGSISYNDSRYITSMTLFYVCQSELDAEANGNFRALLTDDIHTLTDAQIFGDTGSSGKQSYIFNIGFKDVQDAQKKCESNGGVAGYALGIKYHDPGESFKSQALGVVQSQNGTDAVAKGALAVGSLAVVWSDDYAIVGRQNCGANMFAAYADIAGTPNAHGDADFFHKAFYCAIGAEGINPLSKPTGFWSQQELEAAVGLNGPKKSVFCDITTNETNAPHSPVSNATSKVEIAGGQLVCRDTTK